MKKLLLTVMVFLLLFLSVQLPGPDLGRESGRASFPPNLATEEDKFHTIINDRTNSDKNQPEEHKTGYDKAPNAENLPQETNSPPPPAKETGLDGAGGQQEEKIIPAPATKANDTQPEQNSKPEENKHAADDTEKDTQYVLDVFLLTNAERAKAGLEPLRLHQELCDVALIKAREMHDHEYFSHDSPTYGSPLDMVNYFSIPNKGVGENIAGGYRKPEDVIHAWMQSDSHRANILRPEFKSIGIGFYRGVNHYKYYWVQLFVLE